MNDAAWLAWIEQLAVAPAGHDLGRKLPRSRFHCRLDDQPDHLVPERLLRPEYWEDLAGRPLFLNPDCRFTGRGEIPPEAAAAGFPANEMAGGEMMWLRDPAHGALQPFWLGRELCAMLSGTQPGDPAPTTLSPQARHTLIMANVLVPEDYASYRRQHWTEIISATRPSFNRRATLPSAGLFIHSTSLPCGVTTGTNFAPEIFISETTKAHSATSPTTIR